jgi:DUF4097 and DUF4098 domain-containing protein YvlB
MTVLTLPLAVFALTVAQQYQTDTTVAVPAGARLELRNHSGSVHITSWDRNEMRVRAEHGSRDEITIDVRGAVVRVDAHRRRGGPPAVDSAITVPRTMSLDLNGVENEITVEGVSGDITAGSVEGDITIRGAGGTVSVNTVEGGVIVEGGRGHLQITGVEGDIQVTGAEGEITVETVDGDVTLARIESSSVDVSTVDGDVDYQGSIRDGGTYRFTSHDGDLTLAVPASLNATFTVATWDGSFEADPAFRIQLNKTQGRRFNFVLGSGSARVELESFDGAIELVRR